MATAGARTSLFPRILCISRLTSSLLFRSCSRFSKGVINRGTRGIRGREAKSELQLRLRREPQSNLQPSAFRLVAAEVTRRKSQTPNFVKKSKRPYGNRGSADISFSAYSAYFAVNLFPYLSAVAVVFQKAGLTADHAEYADEKQSPNSNPDFVASSGPTFSL